MNPIQGALLALATARQAEFDEAAQTVYLHLLRDVEPHYVVRACSELAIKTRADYESAMPPVATIRSLAGSLAQSDRAKNYLPSYSGEPADPERLKRFLADVKARLRGHEPDDAPREDDLLS